jgi:hypothetical protein
VDLKWKLARSLALFFEKATGLAVVKVARTRRVVRRLMRRVLKRAIVDVYGGDLKLYTAVVGKERKRRRVVQ